MGVPRRVTRTVYVDVDVAQSCVERRENGGLAYTWRFEFDSERPGANDGSSRILMVESAWFHEPWPFGLAPTLIRIGGSSNLLPTDSPDFSRLTAHPYLLAPNHAEFVAVVGARSGAPTLVPMILSVRFRDVTETGRRS